MQRLWQLFNSTAARPLRFILIGGMATCVHLSVALLITVTMPKMSVYLSNLVAFVFAFGASYWGHRHFTFQRAGSLKRFFIVAIAGLAANNLILTIGMQMGLNRITALTTAVIMVPVLSYFASSLWAFASEECKHSLGWNFRHRSP